jgi:GT2 family glycosyltransferase
MTFLLTGSIVAYNNDPKVLSKAIESFLNTSLSEKLYLVDNSSNDSLRSLCTDPRCEYIHNNENLGFGKAHNIALRKTMDMAKYHLVLNPDVYFESGTIERLIEFVEKDQSIGLVIPKVLDLNSNIQHVCKRLPSPFDLIIRRITPDFFNRLFSRRLNWYEMRDMDYNKPFEAPSLSGCFMLFKTQALKEVGIFDERFFMYMEDIDISRRVHKKFKTMYDPERHIFHSHARESYRLNKLFFIHALSAIKYFNKWGWIFDKDRK